MDKVPKRLFSQLTTVVLFLSLVGFLTLAAGTHRLSRNIGAELPFFSV
jgi:hypothetical protein